MFFFPISPLLSCNFKIGQGEKIAFNAAEIPLIRGREKRLTKLKEHPINKPISRQSRAVVVSRSSLESWISKWTGWAWVLQYIGLMCCEFTGVNACNSNACTSYACASHTDECGSHIVSQTSISYLSVVTQFLVTRPETWDSFSIDFSSKK